MIIVQIIYNRININTVLNCYEIVHSGWQLHNDLDADSKWKYTKGLSLDSILGYSNKVEYNICNIQDLHIRDIMA